LIVGAGGHGRVVADAALSSRSWDTVAFLDDRASPRPLDLEVVGALADLEQIAARFDHIALGVGDNRARWTLYTRCVQARREHVVIAHASAAISPYARIGAGTVIFAQAVVNPGAVLGGACIVNSAASIDHDCTLGDAVHVSPGANLAGNVRVGARTWIGIGACVRQGITIGADVIVGAGSVVVSDVGQAVTVFGVPAKVRK
jgi:sugar O-acyltransferase (sialic acid O-acetyltransferase NeuD family)